MLILQSTILYVFFDFLIYPCSSSQSKCKFCFDAILFDLVFEFKLKKYLSIVRKASLILFRAINVRKMPYFESTMVFVYF